MSENKIDVMLNDRQQKILSYSQSLTNTSTNINIVQNNISLINVSQLPKVELSQIDMLLALL